MVERRLLVRDTMTREPVTVSPRMRVNHAAALMRDHEVSSLVVVSKGTPVGIVTERDIVEKAVAANQRPSQLTVKDVMSSPLLTTAPDVELADAARKMATLRIRRLAVLEGGELVGMLTEGDLLRISPELIDITREYERLERPRDRPTDVVTMGICENCQAFSEELRERDSLHLCNDCLEDFED